MRAPVWRNIVAGHSTDAHAHGQRGGVRHMTMEAKKMRPQKTLLQKESNGYMIPNRAASVAVAILLASAGCASSCKLRRSLLTSFRPVLRHKFERSTKMTTWCWRSARMRPSSYTWPVTASFQTIWFNVWSGCLCGMPPHACCVLRRWHRSLACNQRARRFKLASSSSSSSSDRKTPHTTTAHASIARARVPAVTREA